jgi:hypothetical protein
MKIKSKISKHFEKFLEALQSEDEDIDHPDIGFQIYYDLFKIRDAQWKYKLNVNRKIDYSLSDIFQDIVAHYLRKYLPKKYNILIEDKDDGKLRPDILIKKGDKNWAVIEIKTTIGWKRGIVDDKKEYLERLKKLSKQFKVPMEKTFYIFEASRNVNKKFSEEFRGDKTSEIPDFIFPLFERGPSAYYLTPKKKREEGFKKYKDKEILSFYKANKITDFKHIIKKIKK